MTSMMKIKTFPNGRIVLQLDDVVLFEDIYVSSPIEAKRCMAHRFDLMVVGEKDGDWLVNDCSSNRLGDVDFAEKANQLELHPIDLIGRLKLTAYKVIKRGKKWELVKVARGESVAWAVSSYEETFYYGNYWQALAKFIEKEARDAGSE